MPSQEQGAVQRPEPKAGGQSAPVEIDEMQTRPGRTNRLSRRLERFFTLLLCVILVLVILCVAAAYLSEDANTFISSTLHVDIRAEIAYLWQLITHLF